MRHALPPGSLTDVCMGVSLPERALIVLRIDLRGHSADVRWAGAEAVIGSGPAAHIRRDDAGWAAREAVLVHQGHAVVIVPAGGASPFRLRVGDSAILGGATITLEGILPLPSQEQEESEQEETTGPEPEAAPAKPVGSVGLATTASADAFRLAPEASAAPASRPALPPSIGRPAASPPPRRAALSPQPSFAQQTFPPTSSPRPAPAPATPPPSVPFFRRLAAVFGLSTETPPAPAPAPAAAPKPRWREAREARFDDELYATLKRSPWFALSAGIHAVLLGLLLLLMPASEPKPPPQTPYGILSQTAANDDTTLSGGPTDTADRDIQPEEVRAPDLDLPEPDPVSTPDELMVNDPDASPSPSIPELQPLPQDDPPTSVPIIGPSRGAVIARVAPKTSSPKATTDDVTVNLDKEHAHEVNRKAAARVRDEIVRGGGALGKALRGLKRDDILVIRGTFDHMETVLEELTIPFTLKSPFELASELDLSKTKILFWNCGESVLPPRFRAPVTKALQEYVRGGGYLFTTDWALANVLMPTFPGFLSTTRAPGRELPELVVHVKPNAANAGHALLDGVFDEEEDAKWWLEETSQDVQVLKPSEVEVLVEAPALSARPYDRSPVIAATFVYGRGRVLHVMGHYYQQKGNLRGAMGVQRLPLNFVRMRLERDAPLPAR